MLASGKRFCSIRCKTKRLCNTFSPMSSDCWTLSDNCHLFWIHCFLKIFTLPKSTMSLSIISTFSMRDFFLGPWAGSRRTTTVSFLRNNNKQVHHCDSSLCNYHEHHIRNVQRCSFVLLFVHRLSWIPRQFVVTGDVRSGGGGSITTSWDG